MKEKISKLLTAVSAAVLPILFNPLTALIGGLLLFIGLNAWYIDALFEPGRINAWEIRYYLVWAMLLLLVVAFSTLRLYNAVVINTRFMLKLQIEIRALNKEIKKLERTSAVHLKSAATQMGQLGQMLSGLIKALRKAGDDD